jgi:hypothetical protein
VAGSWNTAVGSGALHFGGSGNTAVGYSALQNNHGADNVAIGYDALLNNTTGSGNIAIGVEAGVDVPGNFNNTISIGNNGWLNGFSNQVFIGNPSTSWIGGYKPWSVYSDARIKNNITEEVRGLDFISRLRPVTYYIDIHKARELTGNSETPDFPGKYDAEKVKLSGFLAQEVEQAAKESNYEFDAIKKPHDSHDLYTLSYELFVVPLVKAVQEQQATINKQQLKIDDLEKRLIALEKK